MTEVNFHVLGGANAVDVFYHQLFTHHVREVHGIELTITYDSSVLFKGLAIGRYIPVVKADGSLCKMDLRSNALYRNFDGQVVEDKVYNLLNEIAGMYNLKPLDPAVDLIYDPETKTFGRTVHMYLIFYMLQLYRHLEVLAIEKVAEVYPMYRDGEIEKFDRTCIDFTRKLNQGKSTKKQRVKTYSIYKTLNILTELNEEYNQHLVTKFMASDDAQMVGGTSTILF